MIITNTSPGSFQTDGSYIDLVSPPPPVPTGPNTALIAIVGAANYGPVNTPTPFIDSTSAINAFGNGTTLSYSLIDEALGAMPEGQQFLGVRVTDSTDTSATIDLVDSVPANVIILTAKYTGTYANGATARIDLASGTSGAAPIYNITINFPGVAAEFFPGIVGSTSGGAYSATAFQANALAAINGTIAGQPGSVRWTATAGSSTIAPVTGVNTAATGGTNGTSSLTTTLLLGTDGTTGRTGVYSLRGQVQGAQVFIAQLTTATLGQSLVTFASQENCSVWMGYASLTSTTTEVSTRATDNLSAPNLFLASDWDWEFDSIAGLTRLRSPIGPLAGAISAQPPWMYPGNKPAGPQGKIGIISTDRNGNPNTNPPSGGTPISVGEAGVRQTNGILYLTNDPLLYSQNSGYGLPHGMASNGTTLISDTRMTQNIAFSINQLQGKYVGSMIGFIGNNLVVIGPNGQEVDIQAVVDAYLSSLLSGSTPQILAFQNTISASNNTVQSTQQGFLIANIYVTTLSAAKFLLSFLNIGNTVQIPAVQISQAA